MGNENQNFMDLLIFEVCCVDKSSETNIPHYNEWDLGSQPSVGPRWHDYRHIVTKWRIKKHQIKELMSEISLI